MATPNQSPETKQQGGKSAGEQAASGVHMPMSLGITVSGIVNHVQKTKTGKYMMRISTDSCFITVFTKDNGVQQGDFYHAKLRGLTSDQYRNLSAFEQERLG